MLRDTFTGPLLISHVFAESVGLNKKHQTATLAINQMIRQLRRADRGAGARQGLALRKEKVQFEWMGSERSSQKALLNQERNA